MSRIGRKPVQLNEKVTVTQEKSRVLVKGPQGELEYEIPSELKVSIHKEELVVEKIGRTKKAPALWGLWRVLLANAVRGVQEKFEKKLELVGVGYRVVMKGKDLELQLGFSHPVYFTTPEGIELNVDGQIISVSGIDRQLVGQVAANIRKLRPPEPYKGKGVRYIDEYVRRKPGKSAKTVGTAGG